MKESNHYENLSPEAKRVLKGVTKSLLHVGTTAAEESLIRAAIAHVKRLGLVSGEIVDAVRAVERERQG